MSFTTFNTLSNESINHLFEKYDAFFCFSDEQFNKNKKEGVTYERSHIGAYVRKGTKNNFAADMAKVFKDATERYLAINTRDDIILAELVNHECFYNRENIDEAFEMLSNYGFTMEETMVVYNANKNIYD